MGCGDPTGVNTCRVDEPACACVHSDDDDFRWYGDTQYVVGLTGLMGFVRLEEIHCGVEQTSLKMFSTATLDTVVFACYLAPNFWNEELKHDFILK